MGAYNVVRFRVKPGCEQRFIDAHKKAKPAFKGFRGGALVKTGERDFCFVGEWSGLQKIAGARPIMIGLLDARRPKRPNARKPGSRPATQCRSTGALGGSACDERFEQFLVDPPGMTYCVVLACCRTDL